MGAFDTRGYVFEVVRTLRGRRLGRSGGSWSSLGISGEAGRCSWGKARTSLAGGRSSRGRLLEGLRNGGRLYGGEGRAGMGDRRVRRGLGACLRLLTFAVDVLILGSLEAEGTELEGGAIDLLAVSGHPNGLLLVEQSPLVAGGARASAFGGLGSGSGKARRRSTSLLVLLLGGGERGHIGAGGGGTGVPGIRSLAVCSFGQWRLRFVQHALQIRLGELVLGGRQNNLRDDNSWDGGGLLRRLGFDLLGGGGSWLGLEGGGFDRREGLNDGGLGGLRYGELFGLGRELGRGRLAKHASPGLLCASGRSTRFRGRRRSGGRGRRWSLGSSCRFPGGSTLAPCASLLRLCVVPLG